MGDEDRYLCAALLGVLPEVEVRPISYACELHPPVISESFSIPTVDCVMRHLIWHVLSKPQPRFLYAHTPEELVGARDMIP
jgi:hypothetical protein